MVVYSVCQCVVGEPISEMGGREVTVNDDSTTSWMEDNSNLTLGVAVPAPLPTQQSQCSVSQLMDATPIRGWCCDCWNSTNPDVSNMIF